MPSDIISSLASRAEADLRKNILPYWMRVAPDPSGVGFVGEVRYGEEVDPQAPRGCLLASRILLGLVHQLRVQRGSLRVPPTDRVEAGLLGHRVVSLVVELGIGAEPLPAMRTSEPSKA